MEYRRPDIKQWIEKAKSFGCPLNNVFEQNTMKKERLEKSGLPIATSYGPFDSFEEIDKVTSPEKRDKIIYFLRCVPKDYKLGKNSEIKRFVNINYSQAKDFYKKISDGPEKYTAQLFETWEPEYSGGLIINNGRVMIDLEKGDRFCSKKDEVKGASLELTAQETKKITIHFEYANNPTEKEKEIMLNALKYINPDLKRDKFEQLKVYAEYFYKKEVGFKFVDYLEGEEVEKYASFNRRKNN